MKLYLYVLLIYLFSNSAFAADWSKLIDKAFPDQKFQDRNGPRTDALLIWQNNELVIERYDRGYTSEKKHVLWSISKSITSLLLARAEAESLIKRDDSICKFEEVKDKSYCKIRYQDLVHWTSGLKWLEEYENSEKLLFSSVIAMLYGEGYSNMKSFVLRQPLEANPGEQWRYSSGDSNLLAALLPKVFGESSAIETYKKYLYQPLGIQHFTIELDASGNAVGASHFYLRPNDIIKIGRLILQKGQWESKQLLPPGWMDYILKVPPAFNTNRKNHESRNIPGGGFWINKSEGTGMEKPWPLAPEDTILATGHWGQFLVVIPSMNLIGVRTGDTRDKSFKSSDFIKLLVEGARQ